MPVDPYAAALMAFSGGLSAGAGPIGLGGAMAQQPGRSGLASYLDMLDREEAGREREMASLLNMAKLQQWQQQAAEEQRQRAGLAQLVAAAPESLQPIAQAVPEVYARGMMQAELEGQGGGGGIIPGATAATQTAMQEAQLLMMANPGMTWGEAIQIATGNAPKPIVAGDRIFLEQPGGGYEDATPPLQIPGAPLSRPAEEMGLAEATQVGTGLMSGLRTGIGRTLGQFWSGAASPHTESGRALLAGFSQDVRDFMAMSGRPTNWQLERIEPLLSDPRVWDSPENVTGRMRTLRQYLANRHDHMREALGDPALTGEPRAQMNLKRAMVADLIGDIDAMLSTPMAATAYPETRSRTGVPLRNEPASVYGGRRAVPGGLVEYAPGKWRLAE